MIPTKQYFILQVIFLVHLLYTNNALQCKTCEKDDPSCLLAHDVEIRDCPSDDDFCYSWFDRTRSEVGVQRGCMSTDMEEYKVIRKMLGNKDNECFKRLNGLDCFKLCSNDVCN